MQSSLYRMIEKAKRYADEPDRIQLTQLQATVRGNHHEHTVSLADGRLRCTCDHYAREGLCAHVLFVERQFQKNLPANAAPYPGSQAEPVA